MARVPDRVRYKQRIQGLISKPPSGENSGSLTPEIHAHWAKYTCVLISGYIEQSLKEIFLEHASQTSAPRIRKYLEGTWPNSKNMKCDAIRELLAHFDLEWAEQLDTWLETDERKKDINEIIAWRNSIAHGKEANTNNVTINAVARKFSVACSLVAFIEQLQVPQSA